MKPDPKGTLRREVDVDEESSIANRPSATAASRARARKARTGKPPTAAPENKNETKSETTETDNVVGVDREPHV